MIGRVGKFNVENRLEIYPTAVVNGDINYGQIFIHADARVNGQLTCLLEESNTEPVVKKLKAV